MNPDTKPRQLAGCVYAIEALDLGAHGFPGVAFSGDLHIEPDPDAGDEAWFIWGVCASDPHHDYTREPIGAAVVKAVLADPFYVSDITDECVRHGEG